MSDLDKLKERRDRLTAQIKRQQAREKERQRKQETRRKILLGSITQKMIERGEIAEETLCRYADRVLTRKADRELFNLGEKENAS